MEEEISKEKNKQRKLELIKKQNIRDYVRASDVFQNLFDLPISIGMEYIVERYMLLDKQTENAEISEEILTGIHKEIVFEISNDKNGIVLNSDGTINEEASRIQEKEIEKEEKRSAFYKDDDINDFLKIDPKGKEERLDVQKEFEEFQEKFIPNQNGISEKDFDNKFNNKSDKYNRNTLIENLKRNIPGNTALGEWLLESVVKINERIIHETKYGNFDAEQFSKMSPAEKYAIKRSLLLEMVAGNAPSEILTALRKIEPDYEKASPSIICQDIISGLRSDDNVLNLLHGDRIDKFGPEDFISDEMMHYKIHELEQNNQMYHKNGTIDYKVFKDIHGENSVNAALYEYKKNIIERITFASVKRFSDRNGEKLVSMYKEFLRKEADALGESDKRDDPEFWKTIKPRHGTALELLEKTIKENYKLLPEYAKSSVEIDFEKVKEAKDVSSREISVIENGINNISKVENQYKDSRNDLMNIVRNINKIKDSQEKADTIKTIRNKINHIPREVFLVDLNQDPEFREYMSNYDPELGSELEKQYEQVTIKIMENKKALENERQADLRKTVEKDKGDLKKFSARDRRVVSKAITIQRAHKITQGKKFTLSSETKSLPLKRGTQRFRIAKDGKGISRPTSLSKYMAKPKMIIDEIEIPVNEETNSERTSQTFETLLKEQGLAAKFKAIEENLTLVEYASKMGDIITNINEKIKDGSLPGKIKVNGQIKETTLKDIMKMNFDNIDILLENFPEDVSKMEKWEIEKLIREQVEDKKDMDIARRISKGVKSPKSLQGEMNQSEQVDEKDDMENQQIQTEQEPEIENSEESKKEKPKDEKEQEEEEVENDVVPVNSDKKEEGPTQDELQERLAREQRDKELAEENKAKEEVKDIVEEAKAEEPKIEEKKVVESEKAIAKDTFFNRVKRGFLNNPVVKKFNELFGKKEEKDVFDTISANDSKNSKPITKEEDDFVQKVDGAKSLKDAHKEMEEKKVRVAVQDSREEEMEIGDE